MDRSELIARTRRLAGVRMEALWPHRAVAEEVNDAYRETLALADWPFLYVDATVTTVAGTPQVGLPTTMREVTGLRIDGERRLREVTIEELDRLPDPGEDEPQAYAKVDLDTVRLWPTPDKAYTVSVRGWQQGAALATDVDKPLFDAEFHPVVAYAAAIRILQQEGDDTGRLQHYQQEAGSILARMQKRYLESHDDGMFQMGGRRDRARRWRLA